MNGAAAAIVLGLAAACAAWWARREFVRLQRALASSQAEADRAEALLAAGLERENRLHAANAALRRALDAAEQAGDGRYIGTVVMVHRNALQLAETVTGENVLN